MSILFFINLIVTFALFVAGNMIKWQDSLFKNKFPSRGYADSKYNAATLIITILLIGSYVALIFTADSIVIGIVAVVLMHIAINPVLGGLLTAPMSEIVLKIRKVK